MPESYADLLERARDVFPGMRVGWPGRGRLYWPLYPPAQLLRLRWAIRVQGADHIAPGPAILVGNHLTLLDPVLVGVANRWRLTFFAKVELFEGPGAFFFRITGQIPLRRGDEASTKWALAMSTHALAFGSKLAVYPEGTRSPDGRSLHRLHRRVLVPILQANPDVPVHAMTIAYPDGGRLRQRVDLRFSPRLDVSADMDANALTQTVTDALLDLGGMPYVPHFAR